MTRLLNAGLSCVSSQGRTIHDGMAYPDSDGMPIADNTLQFRWIVTFQGGLDAAFRADPNVFVAGDLLWYPVEGEPKLCAAPDVMVAFGRPKGSRGSYMQWLEGGVAPQVVFEVMSPNNRPGEMIRKFQFYERHGVEEYYLHDPDKAAFDGWLRAGNCLEPIAEVDGWISPRLEVRFDLSGDELRVLGPAGRPFATYVELVQQREELAQQREAQQLRAERLAAQLRALGIEPDA